jgi:adenine phosphoribosyltransferase
LSLPCALRNLKNSGEWRRDGFRRTYSRRAGFSDRRDLVQRYHAGAQNADAFKAAVEALARPYVDAKIDKVVAIESRGFIFGAPWRSAWGRALSCSQAGKLPSEDGPDPVQSGVWHQYAGTAHDAIQPGERVLVVDDCWPPGDQQGVHRTGTRLGGVVVGLAFLVSS